MLYFSFVIVFVLEKWELMLLLFNNLHVVGSIPCSSITSKSTAKVASGFVRRQNNVDFWS